jgi:PPOX class probable F420-dependent enzyme
MTAPAVPDAFRDLLDAATGILATNGPDGLPQVTAVTFLHDTVGDLVKISLNDTRQKTKNMRRDSRATLFILDRNNPYRSLEIRARVELAPDPDFSFAKTAGAKYGQDFHVHDQPGETRSVVTLHPVRINATLLG